jgi:hypothetical protein
LAFVMAGLVVRPSRLRRRGSHHLFRDARHKDLKTMLRV